MKVFDWKWFHADGVPNVQELKWIGKELMEALMNQIKKRRPVALL